MANTLTRNGKRYPKLPKSSPGTRSTGATASCDLQDVTPFTVAAKIDLEGPKKVAKDKAFPATGPMVAIWSPPNPDWVVQSYTRVVTTSGGTVAASDSGVPSGFSSVSTAQYNTVRQATHNYILSLSIPDVIKAELTAEADSLVTNSGSYAVALNMSHGGVRHEAQVWGTGVLNMQQGHSWYHGHINGTLTCYPAYLRDMNAMTQRMKQWVDNTVASLPRQLQPAQRIDATRR